MEATLLYKFGFESYKEAYFNFYPHLKNHPIYHETSIYLNEKSFLSAEVLKYDLRIENLNSLQKEIFYKMKVFLVQEKVICFELLKNILKIKNTM